MILEKSSLSILYILTTATSKTLNSGVEISCMHAAFLMLSCLLCFCLCVVVVVMLCSKNCFWYM